MGAVFLNTAISIVEASLAAGVGAMIAKEKPVTQAGSMTALALLTLALAGAMSVDYIGRMKKGSATPITVVMLLLGLGSFFVYWGIRKSKGKNTVKNMSGTFAGSVFIMVSISCGWLLAGLDPQSVILSNMYVLLGGIIGYSGQQSTKNKAAMANQIMAGGCLILLLAFDTIGARDAARAAANAAGANTQSLAPAPAGAANAAVTGAPPP